jgi:hypothetical protein
MPTWKDLGRYVHEIKLPAIRITVHHYIGYAPDEWFVSTLPSLFSRAPLQANTLKDAKAEALRLVRERCQEIIKATEEL